MMATDFAKFQRNIYRWLTYLSVCRYYIEEDENGRYVIKKAGPIRLLFYYALWRNSLVKLLYLVLTYRGYLVEVHFLDQMSICDYLLGYSELFQEANMWYRKYPLYEVLHSNWKFQEEVFRKLGSPHRVEINIIQNDRGVVAISLGILTIGCACLVFQLRAAPKYALYTYALIPYEHWLLEILLQIHEVGFMFHIYTHQTSSVVLVEMFASSYTHLVREMTNTLKNLITQGKPTENIDAVIAFSNPAATSNNGKYFQRQLDLRATALGTTYNITELLTDYKKMMLGITSFNNWAGRLQGGTTVSNYFQFVSDVFIVFQLLKEPDTDFMAVFFFLEDACAGMVMLFRMLIVLSWLYPASEEFLHQLRNYAAHDIPQKRYFLKELKTCRIMAAQLGGIKIKGITVPKGIHTLMNWYVCAAMWNRPADRKT